MAKRRGPKLDLCFAALADPTRRAMVERLAKGGTTVGQLAEPFDFQPPTISRHLKVLEQAGLIVREREGRVHFIQLDPEPLRDVNAWLDRYCKLWENQLDRLADYLEKEAQE